MYRLLRLTGIRKDSTVNTNNTLSILDSFSRELGKYQNVTKAVTEITTHSMFPSNVSLSVAGRQLKLAQDGEIVLTLNYHSTTDLMARIIEACTLIRCKTPREHMLNRMANEG
jgi:hypothetical protein